MRPPAIKDHYPALGYQQLSELRVLFQDNDDGKQPNRSLTVNRQAVLMALYSLFRIGECAALKWAWINQDARTIEIPRERMKMRRDFRIPVTPQIDALLEYVKAFQESRGIVSEYVFSISGLRQLYAGAPANLMRRYFRGRMVIHGIRSRAGPGWPSMELTSQSLRPASRMSSTMRLCGLTAVQITWSSAGKSWNDGTSTSMKN